MLNVETRYFANYEELIKSSAEVKKSLINSSFSLRCFFDFFVGLSLTGAWHRDSKLQGDLRALRDSRSCPGK